MGDVAKAAGKFFARDLFYVVSGLCILTALAQFWGEAFASKVALPDLLKLDAPRLILLFGSAYFLGFVVKEAFGYLRITVEGHDFIPSRLDKLLYKQHQGKPWIQPEDKNFDVYEAYLRLQKAGDVYASRYDRISNVVHVLSITGTGLTFCGILFLLHVEILGAVPLILGVMSIEMSRFHTMRRLQCLSKLMQEPANDPKITAMEKR